MDPLSNPSQSPIRNRSKPARGQRRGQPLANPRTRKSGSATPSRCQPRLRNPPYRTCPSSTPPSPRPDRRRTGNRLAGERRPRVGPGFHELPSSGRGRPRPIAQGNRSSRAARSGQIRCCSRFRHRSARSLGSESACAGSTRLNWEHQTANRRKPSSKPPLEITRGSVSLPPNPTPTIATSRTYSSQTKTTTVNKSSIVVDI